MKQTKTINAITITVTESVVTTAFSKSLPAAVDYAHELNPVRDRAQEMFSPIENLPSFKSVKKTGKFFKKTEKIPFSFAEIETVAKELAKSHGIGTYVALIWKEGAAYGGITLTKQVV